jgi:hypothetical protein
VTRPTAADNGRGWGSVAGREAGRETVLPVERKVRREGEGGDISTAVETRLEGRVALCEETRQSPRAIDRLR